MVFDTTGPAVLLWLVALEEARNNNKWAVKSKIFTTGKDEFLPGKKRIKCI